MGVLMGVKHGVEGGKYATYCGFETLVTDFKLLLQTFVYLFRHLDYCVAWLGMLSIEAWKTHLSLHRET